MNHCSSCGQDSPTNTNFCIKCGVAFAASGPSSNSGRPVISMDPRKQGQLSENAKQYSSQNLNPQTPQTPQFQSPPPSQQASRKGNQQSKIVMGVVGALIPIGIRVHQALHQVINNLNQILFRNQPEAVGTTQAMTITHMSSATHLSIAVIMVGNMSTAFVCWKP